MHKGANVVRAAIINGGGATDFCAGFLDAEDRPIQGYTVSLADTARLTGKLRLPARLRCACMPL